MKLVIAEKPSVGAAIAAVMGANEKRSGYFEGGGYLVSWCIGHLISLADAATYNEQFRKWKYDDLPIVPQEWQFIVASGKEQQFSILKDLMHRSDVTEIINACDSGREGELIFRFVYEQANCKKPFSRLWISSMEASAIREGFSNLKDGRGYPYFLCMDADSILQYDSLEKIVRPVLEEDNVVAVGGAVRPCNGAEIETGRVVRYRMPRNLLACMQVLEYDRSFLAARIMFDQFNGSIIISGAFGLFQSMYRHKNILANPKYGMVSFISYLYFLIYELLSPYIEVFGVVTMVLACVFDFLNVPFMLLYLGIYIVYTAILSLTAFFARMHTIDLKLSFTDVLKAIGLCALEVSCLRFILAWVRMTALIGYRGKKRQWQKIERKRISFK